MKVVRDHATLVPGRVHVVGMVLEVPSLASYTLHREGVACETKKYCFHSFGTLPSSTLFNEHRIPSLGSHL